MKILCASVLLLTFVIVNSSGQSVRQGTQELFVSEVIRVRRQAGYVYNKPSVTFDLPSRAPSSTVTTQAPTVDRTQAQMMYYAYPAPASGSGVGASAGPTVGSAGGSTATGSTGISGGYNYGAQNAASVRAQTAPITSSSQTGSIQSSSASSSGYGYNAPMSNESTQKSRNSESSGYGYNAPSAGAAQISTSVESTQTGNARSSQTGSVAGPGYEYITPTNNQGSEPSGPSTDVSTNAPKYLPPTSGSSRNSNDILSGSVVAGGEPSGTFSGSSASITQPLDQYLPPFISNPDSPSATPIPVVDQYLPPNESPASPVSRIPTGNKEVQSDIVTRPNANYIPPQFGQSPTSVIPRPFSSAALTDGYLPPAANPQGSAPSSSSTPASPYLPPVF